MNPAPSKNSFVRTNVVEEDGGSEEKIDSNKKEGAG